MNKLFTRGDLVRFKYVDKNYNDYAYTAIILTTDDFLKIAKIYVHKLKVVKTRVSFRQLEFIKFD
jgi:hypothetical protein